MPAELISKKVFLTPELDYKIRLTAAAERTNGNEFIRCAIAEAIQRRTLKDEALRMIIDKVSA